MSNHTFAIPDSWWNWIIPICLVLGGWMIKIVRDALMSKNAEMIVKRLLTPDNSGFSPLQKLIREEMLRHQYTLVELAKRRDDLKASGFDGPGEEGVNDDA